ncbi:NADP(+)-dependent dehydrogenase [Colletotrichum tofieldiae]|nr:NADP(+)-dependent dehydrogenase [Colletotrichum tofieldiae]
MSYTQATHSASYPAISPSNPSNSAARKVVLVTGAGSGIGQAAATSFAIAGAKALILIGRRLDFLAKTAAIISTKNPDVEIRRHAIDICDAETLKSAMAETVSAFGPIDIVIHAAGVLPNLGPISTTPVNELWKAFEVNIKGTLSVAQALLATDISEKRASSKPVLVTLNTAGILMPPLPGMGGYVVSKAPLLKLMEYLAAENPDKLRTVTVHPGLIRTPMALELEKTGLKFPYDDVSLPADFLVWVTSAEASFLNGKFVFANWDIEELKARRAEIENGMELSLVLSGFPRVK